VARALILRDVSVGMRRYRLKAREPSTNCLHFIAVAFQKDL
jgi:hypothetical protein